VELPEQYGKVEAWSRCSRIARFVMPPWASPITAMSHRSTEGSTEGQSLLILSKRNPGGDKATLSGVSLIHGLGICLILSLTLLVGCLSRSLTSLQVLPAAGSATAAVGQTSQFQALAGYTESGHANTTTDMTSQATWQSSNPAVATISATGLATAVSAGTANISASLQGSFGIVVGTSNLTVTSGPPVRTLASVTVIPTTQAVSATGETAQYIAIGTYNTSPLTQDLTHQVSWSSSDVKIAQISTVGLATAVGLGSATITALATDSNGAIITANAAIVVSSPTGPVSLPTLTVYKVGNGIGTVTGTGTVTSTVVINCGSGTGCIGNFPLNAVVTLVATPGTGSTFDGWSANCTPLVTNPNSCTVVMNNNDAVGAVFDLNP